MNAVKPRQPGSAHDALLDTFDQAGGAKVVADALGVSRSLVYGWTDPAVSQGAPFATLCTLARLHPSATAAAEHLAHCAGGVFMPVLTASAGEWGELSAELTESFAASAAEMFRALADLTMTPAEAARNVPLVRRQINAAARLLARLEAVAETTGKDTA